MSSSILESILQPQTSQSAGFDTIYVFVLIGLNILGLVFVWLKLSKNNVSQSLEAKLLDMQSQITQLNSLLKTEFKANRDEANNAAKEQRSELNQSLSLLKIEIQNSLMSFSNEQKARFDDFKTEQKDKISHLTSSIEQNFTQFEKTIDKHNQTFLENQKEKFNQIDKSQALLMTSTEQKLENIRETVSEKLEKTLSERLGQSFETVGKQLIEVQKGLGEMSNIAGDVGNLKKVLSNVKIRGGLGEYQLSLLLEQILAPEQYEANVKTKENSADLVEYAVKLPGKDTEQSHVWLPIDAKFPKDVFERMQTAYDTADPKQIEEATKAFESTIKSMAKDINEKYISPPATTDFGIMFLPFEGIYSEVVKRAHLLDLLQRDYKIIVTGPSTLAALLNSLQMGFKTLAIQKRSSEVWKVLVGVKKEFESFGTMLNKAQSHFQKGIKQVDGIIGTRTRAIQKKLSGLESLTPPELDYVKISSLEIDPIPLEDDPDTDE